MTENATASEKLTYGQKAVGLTFNPSGDPAVTRTKETCANAIEEMVAFRNTTESTEAKRHASIAITELESACMRAVKALTWKD